MSTACFPTPNIYKIPFKNKQPIQPTMMATPTLIIIPSWSKNVSKTGAYNILPDPSIANRRSFITRPTSMSTTRAAYITSMSCFPKAYIHGEDFKVTGGVFLPCHPYVAKRMMSTACFPTPNISKIPITNKQPIQPTIMATPTLIIPP